MLPIPPAGPAPPPDPSAPGGGVADRPAIQRAAEHLAAGRPEEAVEALARLAAGAPTYAAAHVLHAVALEAAGRPEEALAAWHRAAFLVPRSPLVERERQRLMAAAPEAVADVAPEAAPDAAPPGAVPEPPDPVAERTEPVRPEPEELPLPERTAQDPSTAPPGASPLSPGREGEEATSEQAAPAPVPAEPAEPPPAEPAPAEDARLPDEALSDDAEIPTLQTLSVDDLAFLPADEPGDADGFDPDSFDPDGFDFSAFDLGEDDGDAPDWLTTPGTAEPLQSAWLDDDPAPALPLADWSDGEADGAVRLMPPEGPPAALPPPAEAEADWAVFEDAPGEPGPDAFGLPDPPVGPAEPSPTAPPVADDLDLLIASLEDAPRIRPDPTFSGPAAPPPSTGVDEMASETLARIYAAQHQYVEAALVYEKLAAREPDRAAAMLEQAAEMRRRRAG